MNEAESKARSELEANFLMNDTGVSGISIIPIIKHPSQTGIRPKKTVIPSSVVASTQWSFEASERSLIIGSFFNFAVNCLHIVIHQ